jgi:hypothetical protein
MFISKAHDGNYYIAERSRRNIKLIWSMMPIAPIAADTRIEAGDVPNFIRRRAYKLFETDRLRAKRKSSDIGA